MAKAANGTDDFPVAGNHEERRAWFAAQLKGRSREDCILLAARAALRVAMYLSPSRSSVGLDRKEDYLAFFRCQIIAFSASLPLTIDKEQWETAASTAAAYAAYPVTAFTRGPRARAEAAARSAAVVEAAGASVSAASTVVGQHVSSAAATAAHVVTACFAANIRTSTVPIRNISTIIAAKAFVSDIGQLNDTAAKRNNLTLAPLWPDATPQHLVKAWNAFATALRAMGDDFDIWADWYGGGEWNGKGFPGVLDGTKPRGPSLFGLPRKKALAVSRDIALIPDKFWNEPARVNAKMKRIVAVAREEELQKKENPPLEDAIIEIPPQKPASLEPIWLDGKLRLPSSSAPADIVAAKLSDALQALKQSLSELADDAAPEANIDQRAIAYLRRIGDRIPTSPPTNFEMHAIAHNESMLFGYARKVSEEWPEILAVRYHALTLQFDRTMRQFPDWREFKRNAEKDRLTPEQVAAVPALLKEAVEQFTDKESQEFIHSEIPDAINEIAKPDYQTQTPYDPIEIGGDLLAYDALESINNVIKRIAEAALAVGKWSSPFVKGTSDAVKVYVNGLGKGATRYLKQQGPKDGAALVKWARRGIIASVLSAGLHSKFPEIFGWLARFF